MRSAVLLLVFNRPDTTRQVFEAIRAARPPRLYVSADGPRRNKDGESSICEEVRRLATAVDWPCEVKTMFREKNLGCRLGVSTGISWFFEQEEEGIILEDDVLPLPGFFNYCDELLEKYRNDERIGTIGGCNLISNLSNPTASYFYSIYSNIWGWASWRRVWKHYDVEMKAWPTWRKQDRLSKYLGRNRMVNTYFQRCFDITHKGNLNTWDYQLSFTCFSLGLLTIIPSYNQIRNLGFGLDGTHMNAGTPIPSYIAESIPHPITFPLSHPVYVKRNEEMDALLDSVLHRVSSFDILKDRIKSLPFVGVRLQKILTFLKNN
jgi:hypothetical protein